MPFIQGAKTTVEVIDEAEAYGIRSYIFVPCIVYGKGEGFGNPISIQTVAIIRAAKHMKRMYTVDDSSAVYFSIHLPVIRFFQGFLLTVKLFDSHGLCATYPITRLFTLTFFVPFSQDKTRHTGRTAIT
jgi:hypothetical protein